jgi:hypothetical protein
LPTDKFALADSAAAFINANDCGMIVSPAILKAHRANAPDFLTDVWYMTPTGGETWSAPSKFMIDVAVNHGWTPPEETEEPVNV